jgi:hypothetical protein
MKDFEKECMKLDNESAQNHIKIVELQAPRKSGDVVPSIDDYLRHREALRYTGGNR